MPKKSNNDKKKAAEAAGKKPKMTKVRARACAARPSAPLCNPPLHPAHETLYRFHPPTANATMLLCAHAPLQQAEKAGVSATAKKAAMKAKRAGAKEDGGKYG
jgi:hypothetical protein